MAIRTRIKFCGLTRAEDVDTAIALGVDAIGLVFDPRSRRALNIAQAASLRERVPALVNVVALFRDAPDALIGEVIAEVKPDVLQFHGLEAPAACQMWQRPWIKALGIAGVSDLQPLLDRYTHASLLLLDGHAPGAMGGNGERFDWARLDRGLTRPWMLAGGLGPANVSSAVRMLHPFAVDVSSGIESEPGIKDPERMQAFVDAVREADQILDP